MTYNFVDQVITVTCNPGYEFDDATAGLNETLVKSRYWKCTQLADLSGAEWIADPYTVPSQCICKHS